MRTLSAVTLAILSICGLAVTSMAQTTMEELKSHPEFTASGYSVYPEPDKSVKYTKAPAGYKPFYISHYGRHGSRYHYSADDYNNLFAVLSKADSAKALSVTGKYVMAATKVLAEKAAPRAGDLTQVGARQHEGIAKRMARNFPEIFADRKDSKGKKIPARVDAYASTSGRCILSMSAFLGELRSQKPKVEIHQETGKSLMGFINTFSFDITKNYAETAEYKAESDKLWQDISTRNFVQTLFADTAYASKNVNISELYNKMFEISGSLQGMEEDNSLLILEKIFTKEEKISRWKAQNAWWYSILGTCPLTGDDGVNTAKPVLAHILGEAEKAIYGDSTASENKAGATQSNVAATLRFGHDTAILPLASLMQLSIADAKVSDLSKLHEQWTDFRIIPMAANLQMVFYKSGTVTRDNTAKNYKPVLVKFLYNEREVSVPVTCDESRLSKKEKCPAAPYYRWDDVKSFYSSILK